MNTLIQGSLLEKKYKNRKENIYMYHFVTVPFSYARVSNFNLDISKDFI